VPEYTEAAALQLIDHAFAEARRRAGDWIECRSGCSDCCYCPFAITAADARRLRHGLHELQTRDPGAADAIRNSATALWRRMEVDFPGDHATGSLTPSETWRDWFLDRHSGVACPVLDEATGSCRLYEHRPAACRLYGPLFQIGGHVTAPCPKNYRGATPADFEACRVTLDAACFQEPATEAETVIAFACAAPKIPGDP